MSEYVNNNNSEALDWEDEIEESSGFVLLPDGDYRFTVTGFERGYFQPTRQDSKIPPCNQADYSLTIEWKDSAGISRTNVLHYRLKLTRSLQWLIYEFFESIGLRKKGDGTTKMPWEKAIGCSGICEIGHHDANGKTYNDVNKCYPVGLAPTVVKNEQPASFNKYTL